MISRHRKSTLGLAAIAVTTAMLLPIASASAHVQMTLISHFGGNVNANGTNICLATEACQRGSQGGLAEWFASPESVAIDQQTQAVYVADNQNSRIQKLGPNGEFLLMWGWKVNKKTGGSVCAKAEESECQAGERGAGLAEQMSGPQSVAVDNTCFEEGWTEPTCKTNDPSNGNVYVLDNRNHRVDEFTSSGGFVLMFGGEVNTSGANVCLVSEASKCRSGKAGTAHGFFEEWPLYFGSLLAVGGPSHSVYVADEGRVQEFGASGGWEGELLLTSTSPAFPATGRVTGLTVDSSGDLYITESHQDVYHNNSAPAGVYEFPAGSTTSSKTFDPSNASVDGMTLDSHGLLTVTEGAYPIPVHGIRYDSSGAVLGEFGEGVVERGLAYDDTTGDLYAPKSTPGHEVDVFEAFVTPDVLTEAVTRVAALEALLHGQVNAEPEPDGGLLATSFFEYGRCAPGPAVGTCAGHPYAQTAATTPPEETGSSYEAVQAQLKNLYPNQTYHYVLAARNGNGTTRGEPAEEFTTKPLPPAIEASEAPLVRSESAVLSGSLNPENAKTEYQFEYGVCEPVASCASKTPVQESSVYAAVGLTQEVIGLLPSTTYHFRLVAENEHHEKTQGPEGSFTTAPSVTPEAFTGLPSGETATSAVISGTVNPDGQPAVYAFELGVYNGASTQYGVVFSGPAGASTAPVPETLALSGLQPGTTYAYRITLSSGYVKNAFHTVQGATGTFTTAGLPSVLTLPPLLPQLAIPMIAFPKEEKGSGTTVKTLTNKEKLKKALKACHKLKGKKRASCIKSAHKRYGPVGKRKK